jgi:hypothetical protein
MITKNKKLLILLFVTAFLCLFSAVCRHNWLLHARLNMLLRGCISCRIEAPPDFAKVPDFHPTAFVSGLVYSNGKLMGSLNGYGAFVLRNETDISQDEREARTEIILFVLEYVFGAMSIGVFLAFLRKIAKTRHNRALGQSTTRLADRR